MPDTTQKNKNAKRAHELTAEDRLGMFEAGLEELGKHFAFSAVNVDGGVRLTISGIKRTDEKDGTWHFDNIDREIVEP